MTGIYKVMVWITNLAYLQILWILFSLLGLVVFGVFPATVSVFYIIRRWLRRDGDVPIFQSFWQTYKKEFVRINILGIILSIIGIILYFDMKFFEFDGAISGIGLIIILFAIYMYIGTLIFFFPVYVQFNFKLLDYIKYSFLYSVSSPWITILIMLATTAVLFIFYKIPGLSFFFFISLIGFLWMWGAYSVFERKRRNSEIV